MSSRVIKRADGRTLEGLAYFNALDSLPYSLDSPVWDSAAVWELRGDMKAPAGMAMNFAVRLELLRGNLKAPARMRCGARFAGHEWITKAL